MACQICLEDFDALQQERGDGTLVRIQNLCSNNAACSVDICDVCLKQHIQTAIEACGTGMLPRIRCPICLVPINKTQWHSFAQRGVCETYDTVYQYELRAKQALSLLPPCCHVDGYTHLPDFVDRSEDTTVDDLFVDAVNGIDPARVELKQAVVAFNQFKVDASQVIAALLRYSDAAVVSAEFVLDTMLASLYDDERRAALQLAYLYRHPIILTLCCAESLCFNCKAVHAEDEPCDQGCGFDADTSVVRCRQCRVTLVKTDGCDEVYCPCGFQMQWTVELRWRRMDEQSLLPVDLFDSYQMQLMLQRTRVNEQAVVRAREWMARSKTKRFG